MAKTKTYYYLKLEKDALDDVNINRLRTIVPGGGGAEMTISYLKLMLRSVISGGIIEIQDGDDLVEELALLTGEPVNNIRYILGYIQRYGLGEVLQNSILLYYAVDHIGSESESAARVRRYRERQRIKSNQVDQDIHVALHCNAEVTKCNGYITEADSNKKQQQNNAESNAAVIQLMINAGIQEKDARDLVKTYGTEQATEKTNLLIQRQQMALEGKCKPIDNPGGWVRDAIRKEYVASSKPPTKYNFM